MKPHNKYGISPELTEALEAKREEAKRRRAETPVGGVMYRASDLREHISDSAREAARLASVGLKQNEVAEAMGKSQGFVSNALNTPVVAQHLNNLHAERDARHLRVRKRIDECAEQAVEVVNEMMNKSEKDTVRLKAAIDTLDRAGFKPVQESVKVQAEVGPDVLQLLRERGQALEPVEVEVEVLEEDNISQEREKE